MGEVKTTKAQFATIAAYLSAGVSRTMGREQIDVYYDSLCDLPFPVLQAAARRAIQEQKENFLPAVGAIRAIAAEVEHGMLPQAAQEWTAVRRAVSRFGYPRKAEGLASLSPLARAAADSVGWDTLCIGENMGVLASQFRVAYENLAKRETELRRLSVDVRPAITAGPRNSPLLSITSDNFGRIKFGVNQETEEHGKPRDRSSGRTAEEGAKKEGQSRVTASSND